MKYKKTDSNPNYSAPALEKGLDILELLASEDHGLTQKEIAQRLSRSVGEIFRMLSVLELRGYLFLSPLTDRYSVTMKLFEIAHRSEPVRMLTVAATPVMKQLATEVGQSCHLCVAGGDKALVIVKTSSPSDLNLSLNLGAEIGLLDSCSGLVLMAFRDEKVVREIAREIGKRVPVKELRHVREQGYASKPSKRIQGVHDISSPVFDYNGDILAALTVPYLEFLDNSHSHDIESVRMELEAAASEITRRLGGS